MYQGSNFVSVFGYFGSQGTNKSKVNTPSNFLQHLECVKNKCSGAKMGLYGYARKKINATNKLLEAREFLEEYFKETHR